MCHIYYLYYYIIIHVGELINLKSILLDIRHKNVSFHTRKDALGVLLGDTGFDLGRFLTADSIDNINFCFLIQSIANMFLLQYWENFM